MRRKEGGGGRREEDEGKVKRRDFLTVKRLKPLQLLGVAPESKNHVREDDDLVTPPAMWKRSNQQEKDTPIHAYVCIMAQTSMMGVLKGVSFCLVWIS